MDYLWVLIHSIDHGHRIVAYVYRQLFEYYLSITLVFISQNLQIIEILLNIDCSFIEFIFTTKIDCNTKYR